MNLFAVAGDPILDSKSPDIWNNVFYELGIDAHYFRIQTGSAKEAVKLIKDIGVSGCNITSPLKEKILEFIDIADSDVKKVLAANLIIYKDGKLYGHNTDVYGVTQALLKNGFDPKGKKAVVLGTGGAARAVVYALLKAGAVEVTVAGRTLKKAEKIAKDFGCNSCDIKKAGNIVKGSNILISCVPVAERIVKAESLHKDLTVLDANYSVITTLQKDAANIGCTLINGTEWLLYQAEASFKKFYELEPVEYMELAMDIPNKKKKSYALIGFMGVGKTSYGKKLAKQLGIDFVDLDAEIEKMSNMTVVEIFNGKGEEYFRRLEKETLFSINFNEPKVLSCGGGTVLDEDNVKFLKQHTNIIWLWNDIKIIRSRVNDTTRPLFNNDAEQLLKTRIPIYAKACDVCITSTVP